MCGNGCLNTDYTHQFFWIQTRSTSFFKSKIYTIFLTYLLKQSFTKQGTMVPLPGAIAPSLQFSYQTRSNSFSFKHQGYCFLEVFGNYADQIFHNFYHFRYNSCLIYSGFSFFLTAQGKQITSRWTLWKGPIINAGPAEGFLIVDHPKVDHTEWEFKR